MLSHWLLCVCQVTARLEGRSDYFALVATRDLEPGEQVRAWCLDACMTACQQRRMADHG